MYFQLILTSYSTSEEQNISYLQKSVQGIRNTNEGPQLPDNTAD